MEKIRLKLVATDRSSFWRISLKSLKRAFPRCWSLRFVDQAKNATQTDEGVDEVYIPRQKNGRR